MTLQSISNWDDQISAGRKYLKTATNGLSRPAVFNTELIFQLAAMAIEKFIVGLAQYHHRMPVDHTLSGLVAELLPVCPMPTELADRIKGIEAVDNMCTLRPAHRITPGKSAVEEILAVGREMKDFVDANIAIEE